MDNIISRLLKLDIAGPIIPKQYTQNARRLIELLAQSDAIKRWNDKKEESLRMTGSSSSLDFDDPNPSSSSSSSSSSGSAFFSMPYWKNKFVVIELTRKLLLVYLSDPKSYFTKFW